MIIESENIEFDPSKLIDPSPSQLDAQDMIKVQSGYAKYTDWQHNRLLLLFREYQTRHIPLMEPETFSFFTLR